MDEKEAYVEETFRGLKQFELDDFSCIIAETIIRYSELDQLSEQEILRSIEDWLDQ